MTKHEHIQTILNEIFDHLGENPSLTIENPDENVYDVFIEGNNLNFLIGYRGQSLDALQNIVSMSTYRKFDEPTIVVIDINGYKDRKADKVREMARKHIDKVRFYSEDITLPPMNPWERRHVHLLISEYDDIESESTGEGRDRRVVLKPKK